MAGFVCWQLNFLLRLKAKATLRWLGSWGDLFAALPLTSRFQREAALWALSPLAAQAPAEPQTVVRVRRETTIKQKATVRWPFALLVEPGGFEPPSEKPSSSVLHAYPVIWLTL